MRNRQPPFSILANKKATNGRKLKEFCGFVVSGDDAVRGRPRFCEAPALPGSAYCAEHHARCVVRPGTIAGARLISGLRREAARVAGPPQDLAFLTSVAVAELDSADEPLDLRRCLDVAPHRKVVEE